MSRSVWVRWRRCCPIRRACGVGGWAFWVGVRRSTSRSVCSQGFLGLRLGRSVGSSCVGRELGVVGSRAGGGFMWVSTLGWCSRMPGIGSSVLLGFVLSAW